MTAFCSQGIISKCYRLKEAQAADCIKLIGVGRMKIELLLEHRIGIGHKMELIDDSLFLGS